MHNELRYFSINSHMEQKFQNKYRIQSTRLASWDYGWPGYYFVTICTKHRQCFFGEIHCLSEIGKIVQTEWLKTPEIRPDMNLKLGEFVVMPNHFHAIIQIGENEFNSRQMKQRIASLPPSKPPISIHPETNSDPNPKIWHRLSVDLNLPLLKRHVKFVPISNGNHDSMSILFVMKNL